MPFEIKVRRWLLAHIRCPLVLAVRTSHGAASFLLLAAREALIKSPSEVLTSPMVQDKEEIPANTEVFKGSSDEVLRHRARKSGDSDLISASLAL